MVDFTEIPQGNIASGFQDKFELFAREFFHHLGYEIEEDPSRGADGGKDLVVIQKISDKQKIKFLVSCKHVAHSKQKSVGPNDEQDLSDRIKITNRCDGFIPFYSGIPTSGLSNKFTELKKDLPVEVFDYVRIERELINDPRLTKLFQTFFPNSYKNCVDTLGYGVSEKLLEAYFEKEYAGSLYGHFKLFFGTISQLAFAVKTFKTFEEALKLTRYSKAVLPYLFQNIVLYDMFKHAKYEGGSLKLLMEEYLPKEVMKLHNVNIGNKCLYLGFQNGDILGSSKYESANDPFSYAIYEQYIVGSENLFNVYEEMFQDMKTVI